ncbi:MAG TPA: 2-phospho-L-lactate guanylyltransferase [Ktedonobacteraceae bacterium]|nr:2-phospho-L-lactate guanylyltransferase [Ktedonobacteraceae bacterium]
MEDISYRAIIPVKTLSEAKSRLAPHLTQHQRETLALEMLQHVVNTLRSSETFEVITVVSPDTLVLEKAQLWGAKASIEEQHGHNPALHMAALHDLAEGAGALLTISADLPLLTTGDIRSLLERSRRYDLVLAPSTDGTGTNAILARPPLVVPYLFGINSLKRYLRAARQGAVGNTLYQSQGLSLDIDTIEDVQELESAYRGDHKDCPYSIVMNPRMNAGGLSLPLHTPLIVPTVLPDETGGCMTGQPATSWPNIFPWQGH